MTHSNKHLRLLALSVLSALAVVCAFATHPAPAAANGLQVSMMIDDNSLLYGPDVFRAQTLARMKYAGVQTVKATVLWSVLAQDAKKTKARAKRFRGDNPRSYPARNWDRYDRLAQLCKYAHVGLIFEVTGPGPSWAHQKTKDRLSAPAYRPKPGEFRKLMVALGKRYSGRYKDENDVGLVLPRVSAWSIWNEPNQGASLTPQSEYNKTLRKVIPVAPTLYRELYWAATSGLAATGHARDYVIMGETSPLGRDTVGPRDQLRPKAFIREMFCIQRDGRPYSGAQAKARKCDEFKSHGPFHVSGWGHHPYTQKQSPYTPPTNRDSINMGNLNDLATVLDQVSAGSGGKIPLGLPTLVSENGYQTNPPDPTQGVSPTLQAQYMNEAEFLAWANPRVVAYTQFLFRDVGPNLRYRHKNLNLYWLTWQSGLVTARDKAKPALRAYALPLVALKTASNADGSENVTLWGQLRFRTRGALSGARIQYRAQGSSKWVEMPPATVQDPQNFFTAVRTAPAPGSWRVIAYANDDRTSIVSREAIVAN